jgi:hypothetical protein
MSARSDVGRGTDLSAIVGGRATGWDGNRARLDLIPRQRIQQRFRAFVGYLSPVSEKLVAVPLAKSLLFRRWPAVPLLPRKAARRNVMVFGPTRRARPASPD